MKSSRYGTVAALVILMGWTGQAQAQSGPYGSAQRSTYRSCATKAATERCEGSDVDPSQAILKDVYAGGIGNFTSANLDLDREGTANDAYAHSTVSLGAFNLPEIRAETRAGADDRMNINAFGFQTFTWTGTEATPFSLTGTLHIVDSSASAPDYIDTEPNGDRYTVPGSYLPNGASYTSYVGIWDPSVLNGLTTAEELFGALFLARCNTPGVLGLRTATGSLRGGETSISVTNRTCVNGVLTTDTLMLQPGQQILTVAALQLPVNRGGFADATHTFSTAIDPNLPESVRANLFEKLIPAGVAAVPEPGTWLMMLAGFALAALVLRRGSRHADAAPSPSA
ncbi:hypothetical protein GCM10011380_14610 [Sphingomonas metalli]|uniref:Ice-binding protein C-terminal domain-containing protein n=1 Tax=Sphingomonas metalli TaxID=1779358 RepID=A0A916WSS5_9SPHN|nr:PEP-CTERM sorting domain-containing protein [Sphingomonas metalli]GGB26202.1 hypothetical protein GCM10011380_14610 [Sphingomonas metalli]